MSADPTQPVQPAARQPQEPPTQPAPRWQPPPPPPPPGPQQDRRDPAQAPPAGGRMPRPQQDQQPRQDQRQDQRPPAGGRMPRPPQDQRPQQDQRQDERQQWQPPQDRAPRAPRDWAPGDTVLTPLQAPDKQPRPTPSDQPPQPQWRPRQAPNDLPPQAPGQWQPGQPGQPGQQPASPPRRPRRRRVRRSFMALFAVIVVLVLLVIGDRVALAITENAMADQFAANGLPVKPSVDIEGFPFLTQLAAKDFNKVVITASNVPVSLPGGGNLSITSINATINGLHISSYSSTAQAKVDHITATAFVSFGALAAAGGVGSGTGITLTPDGPNTVKITAGIGGVFSATEEAQITQTGPQTISVKVVNNGTAVGSLLSSFGSFSFSLPSGVPPSLRITSLTLNSQGLTISAAASNATFSKS